MEVRANYIIVGLFTILTIASILAFTIWISRGDSRIEMQEFDIAINDSVSGLGLSSDVLFSGIRVGQVTNIKISPTTPGQVVVRVSIRQDTPVREDSIATLESRGLTGLSVVAINGGSGEAPLMSVRKGQVGHIEYRSSPFAAFKQYVPHTLESMAKILLRIDELLSDKNIAALGNTIQSIDTITQTFANRSESLDAILHNAEIASANLAQLSADASGMIRTDLQVAAKSFNSLAKRLDKTLAAMEPGLNSFSKEGLTNLQMLLVEWRNMTHSFTRLTQRIENNPRQFFFGESTQEFRP